MTKAGWHWKKGELALLRDYIQRRFDACVGWGSGRSEIQEIADRIGRDYFAVYRRMQRLADEMELAKLPRPPRNKRPRSYFESTIVIRTTSEFNDLVCARAVALGMKRSEYVRQLIRDDMEAANCSDARAKAKG